MVDSKKAKDYVVSWRIKAIDLVSFKIEPTEKTPGDVDPTKISFGLNADFLIEPVTKQITITFKAQIFSDNSQSEKFGEIVTKGEYIIENFSEILSESNNQFPVAILASLVGVTLSTSRGFLIHLSKGTVFEKAIIPIINPADFFSEGVKPVQRPAG